MILLHNFKFLKVLEFGYFFDTLGINTSPFNSFSELHHNLSHFLHHF